MNSAIISITTFLPAVGALAILLRSLASRNEADQERLDRQYRWIALIFTIVTFIASLVIVALFDSSRSGPQEVLRADWIRALGVSYFVGVDGISLWLVVLTTFLMPVSVLASWSVNKRVREYMMFMLVLETGMVGVFVALDMFLFYIFWEVTLVPMYFLIGVWGGERRVYAAVKFFLYTIFGSLLMLVAIIAVYYINGGTTFDVTQIAANIAAHRLVIREDIQIWLWLAFGLAFFIKVPLFPFHTWLPDAHVEAPTAGSIILAGVLLKMGTYGLMRFNLPLFPQISHAAAPYVMALAVIGIIYGALVAMVQPDMKKLVAYSSVSHLGFVVLGIFAFTDKSMQGALYQMLNHGVSTGALFLCVGMIYERRHTREIAEFGGIATRMPNYSTLFMVVTLSSLGLPLLNGFIGEFLILLGTFTSDVPHAVTFAVLGATGVILSAVYLLWMMQRVLFGEITRKQNEELTDLNFREEVALVPLAIMALIMGLVPMVFLRPTQATINALRDGLAGSKAATAWRITK